jgi:glycerol uptake facilitator-like aquaporin
MTQRLGAELVGTFALTFVAAGGGSAAALTGGEVTPVARAFAPGLLIMAMIYSIGDRSGAHFNPVVTLAFSLRGLFPRAWVAPYWLAQLGGAGLAAAVLLLLVGPAATAGVSTPHVQPVIALVIEAILTALLVTVILGTATSTPSSARTRRSPWARRSPCAASSRDRCQAPR